MMKRILMAAVAVLTVGCGGSFNGTVGGESLGVASSAAVFNAALGVENVGIVLASFGNVCGVLKGDVPLPEQGAIAILTVTDLTGLKKNESYSVGLSSSGTFATASFGAGRPCSDEVTGSLGQRGSITIEQVDTDKREGSVFGKFDIAFGDDDVTGTFAAAACDVSSFDLCD